ncbi:MAG TPA: DNA methyltransferase, partial [Edaphobacter sp.]|nr:DNA methyltransferase [Edaphobacter sp.]
VAECMRAFRTLLGGSDMLAYLSMMAPRLVELRRVLKETGSIYLHCDPTASHYLKLLMDSIFGPTAFKNEIVWRRTGSHNSAKRYGPNHDTIFFYTKGSKYLFKKIHKPYASGYVETFFKKADEKGKYRSQTLTGAGVRNKESGRDWRNFSPTSKGRHWAFPGSLAEEMGIEELSLHEKLDFIADNDLLTSTVDGLPEYRQYLSSSKGVPLQDIWAYQPYTTGTLYQTKDGIDQDVKWLEKRSSKERKERLGYDTQKPEGLLERILNSSSNEGDVVLDPFCGCGTTVQVAQKLNRRWVGIDITHLAIGLIKTRLDDSFGPEIRKTYEVIGEPTDVAGAAQLAEENKFQFQYWALCLCGARPIEMKKGADRGIDGRLYFHDDNSGKSKQIIFSVKGGHNIGVSEVRDLIGVLQREKAEIGVYISFEEPTKPMQKEAAEAGFYTSADGSRYPRVQLLTVKDLLEGNKTVQRPLHVREITFKKAPRHREAQPVNLSLNLDSNESVE